MVVYQVHVVLEKDIEDDWLSWMINQHIPAVMKTGYFNNQKIYKTILPAQEKDKAAYSIHYECESFENYLAYSENEAPRLQKEHSDKYEGKFTAARSVAEEINNNF